MAGVARGCSQTTHRVTDTTTRRVAKFFICYHAYIIRRDRGTALGSLSVCFVFSAPEAEKSMIVLILLLIVILPLLGGGLLRACARPHYFAGNEATAQRQPRYNETTAKRHRKRIQHATKAHPTSATVADYCGQWRTVDDNDDSAEARKGERIRVIGCNGGMPP